MRQQFYKQQLKVSKKTNIPKHCRQQRTFCEQKSHIEFRTASHFQNGDILSFTFIRDSKVDQPACPMILVEPRETLSETDRPAIAGQGQVTYPSFIFGKESVVRFLIEVLESFKQQLVCCIE